MKQYWLLLISVFFSFQVNLFSQTDDRNINILFSIEDSDLNIHSDTIFFIKEKQSLFYFFHNKVYYNNRKIYDFKNIEYYSQLLFMEYKDNRYLFVYPKYKNRSGPYIWYGLGVLFEITTKEIIEKSNYNYYDMGEIPLLFHYKDFKVVRRISIKPQL